MRLRGWSGKHGKVSTWKKGLVGCGQIAEDNEVYIITFFFQL